MIKLFIKVYTVKETKNITIHIGQSDSPKIDMFILEPFQAEDLLIALSKSLKELQ